jgi:hypothetical protein
MKFFLLSFAFVFSIASGRAIEKAEDRDVAILRCVLTNLLTNEDFPDYRKGYRQATNIVLVKTSPAKHGLSKTQIKHDSSARFPLEEFENMLSRNSIPVTNTVRQVSFESFDFGPNVILADGDQIPSGRGREFDKRFPDAIGWIEAYLPGYSKDGNHALFRASKGPSSHGAVVTAYLEKKENHWSVVWLKVTYRV